MSQGKDKGAARDGKEREQQDDDGGRHEHARPEIDVFRVPRRSNHALQAVPWLKQLLT